MTIVAGMICLAYSSHSHVIPFTSCMGVSENLSLILNVDVSFLSLTCTMLLSPSTKVLIACTRSCSSYYSASHVWVPDQSNLLDTAAAALQS